MRAIILFFLIIQISFATVIEKNKIESLKWDESKQMYRLAIWGKAGVYFSKKKNIKCLQSSLEKKLPMELEYDLKTLEVINCR